MTFPVAGEETIVGSIATVPNHRLVQDEMPGEASHDSYDVCKSSTCNKPRQQCARERTPVWYHVGLFLSSLTDAGEDRE